MTDKRNSYEVYAGITACSNGQKPERKEEITKLCKVLSEMGVRTVVSEHLYAKKGVFGGTAEERANDLMKLYRDDRVRMIFDVSGGDIANEVLGFLDYRLIAESDKMFFGYSDLSTVINAIYTKTGRASSLYQIKNLVWENGEIQRERFRKFLSGEKTGEEEELYHIRCEYLQGSHMEGVVVGGNIRCFLKLAGTPYFPDVKGKILLLESMGGEAPQIATFFGQLEQMGVFEKIEGILLGTFTHFERSEKESGVFELLIPHIKRELPVAKTSEIGHGSDAKAILIGGRFSG